MGWHSNRAAIGCYDASQQLSVGTFYDSAPIYAVETVMLFTPSLLRWFALIALISTVGCGGGAYGTHSGNADGFDNQTRGLASDAQLLELWHSAQARLATAPVSLNPVAVLLNGDPNHIVAPDSRAYQISPGHVCVIAVPDIPLASLPAEWHNGAHPDPTGIIDHCNDVVHYCHASSRGDTVWVAASMVDSDGTTGWEFENIILARLGYDVSKR
jgi:hypothetical protein